MRRFSRSTAEQGQAHWLLLLLVMLAGSYAFYRAPALAGNNRNGAVMATLARAKEALIARAVTDDNRPGSLPCPDLITDSAGLSNFPGDGKADMFTLTQCPSYVGWLPWVTLDLPELTDDAGVRLWYVLAPGLRDDDSAQPINSDTLPGLLLDGRPDIAALIIAARAPLAGQHRPSSNPADYLDGENGNGNDHRYVTGPSGERFNDLVLPITRQELMAAVEKRVANEVRTCLEQHALAHPEQRYPWPAPLASAALRGQPTSRFGRIPGTQPDSGPQAALTANLRIIDEGRNRLAGTTDAAQQLQTARELAEQLVRGRNLLDNIFTAASRIKQGADEALGKLRKIDSAVETACSNDRISVTEGSNIRNLNSATGNTLDALPELLREQGFDPLPWKLRQLAGDLGQADSAAALVGSSSDIGIWLAMATTPREEIAVSIAAASVAASEAQAAALAATAAPGDTTLLANARTSGSKLGGSLAALIAAIEASRVNITSGSVSERAAVIEALQGNLRTMPGPANLTLLSDALESAAKLTESIVSGMPTIVAARNAAATALGTALSAPVERIDGETGSAVIRLRLLGAAIAENEAGDNQLTRTSLLAAIERYRTARDSFAEFDTRSPRPVQSQIVPYARNVQAAAVDLVAWAEMIAGHSALVAPLARANPLTTGSLADSAYQGALDALNSISGKSKLAAQLQTYLDKPTSSNRAKANAGLDNTLTLTATLLERIDNLAGQLPGTVASAAPMLWHSSRCDFLLPGSTSWWQGNAWSGSVFYQIADPLRSAPARLTVNNQPQRLVALLAGQALAGQNRSAPGIADFLEGINADPSRNGDAASPSPHFANIPRSATSNDRLSY